MLKDLIFVGIGGCFGSTGRYWLSVVFLNNFGIPLPWPTFIVNVLGSFLIGILISLTWKTPEMWRLLLITGFCGGFTTFSTFSYENLRLWQEGNTQIALIYIILSLLLGIGFTALGFYATQKLLG